MANDFSIPDTNRQGGPSSQIEIYSDAIDPTVDDEFVGRNRLGLGNYSSQEYWQQVDSFQKGLYAHEAFTRRIREIAIKEAKRKMAEEGWVWVHPETDERVEFAGWNDLDDESRAEELEGAKDSRRLWLQQRGDEVWAALPEVAQYHALVELTGFERDWIPPHWRMLQMRHESSRSRGARLLDNLFGRVHEVKGGDAQLERKRLKNR